VSGLYLAASVVYLHYSGVVSNSQDQFIIRRRLNDNCADHQVRYSKFYMSAGRIDASNKGKNFRIALS